MAAAPEILLIDDEAFASFLRKRVFELKGYRVQMALDATTGIALAEVLRPALVLFDHNLPGMTGPELHRNLLAVQGDTPLVSLSGYDPIEHHYDPLPTAFITKGDSVENMLRTVAELLEKHHADKRERNTVHQG